MSWHLDPLYNPDEFLALRRAAQTAVDALVKAMKTQDPETPQRWKEAKTAVTALRNHSLNGQKAYMAIVADAKRLTKGVPGAEQALRFEQFLTLQRPRVRAVVDYATAVREPTAEEGGNPERPTVGPQNAGGVGSKVPRGAPEFFTVDDYAPVRKRTAEEGNPERPTTTVGPQKAGGVGSKVPRGAPEPPPRPNVGFASAASVALRPASSFAPPVASRKRVRGIPVPALHTVVVGAAVIVAVALWRG